MLSLLEHRTISSGSHPPPRPLASHSGPQQHPQSAWCPWAGSGPACVSGSALHGRMGNRRGTRSESCWALSVGWEARQGTSGASQGQTRTQETENNKQNPGPSGSGQGGCGAAQGSVRVPSCPRGAGRQGLAGAPSRDRPFQCPRLPSSRARNFPSAGPPRPTCPFVTQLPGVWSPGFAHRSSPALASNFCFHFCFSSLPDICYFFYPMCQIALVLGCILPPDILNPRNEMHLTVCGASRLCRRHVKTGQ